MTNDQITVSRELLQQVLDALEKIHNHQNSFWNCLDEITALRAALEQPAVEPAGWCHLQYNEDGTYFADTVQHFEDTYANVPLYTAPQAQPTCKQDLQVPTVNENLTVQVWVQPNSRQFSWEPQDERYWTRLSAPQAQEKP